MADYLSILRQYWGYENFRGIQRQIIESIGSGKDTLGLMPTGGGKSLTFQVPAMAMPGLCLVITPLIALMKDQVENLRARHIKALALHSGLDHDHLIATLDNAIYGQYKFLYISPERLQTEIFLSKLRYMQLSFITVDEAHCISQWGYDFRPAYLQITRLRQRLPQVPVLALTATATPHVVDDIQRQLAFRKPNVFRMSFSRPNLNYTVAATENKWQTLLQLLRQHPGSTIIYTRSRQKAAQTSQWLNDSGHTSTYYHAVLPPADKDTRQHLWQTGQIPVIVATNTFGMGIDKPDVRLVVHLDPPDTLEAYFQEAGRAGRDGQPAWATLLWSSSDAPLLRRRIDQNYPPDDYIRQVYDDLASYYQIAVGEGLSLSLPFNTRTFCTRFRHFPLNLRGALDRLQSAGYLRLLLPQGDTARLIFLLRRDQLYRLNHLPPAADAVIHALLRLYGGLFSQYVPVDEDQIARAARLDTATVTTLLRSLNAQAILHYIPRATLPHIVYTRPRADRPLLPRDTCHTRRRLFARRIQAVIDYATDTTRPCEQKLLSYFGETRRENNRQANTFPGGPRQHPVYGEVKAAVEALVARLGDGEWHAVEALCGAEAPEGAAEALQWLVDNEEVAVRDGMVRLL